MVALEQALAHTIDLEMWELFNLRASQINGCAFCNYMHITDPRKRSVDEMKLYLLNAWARLKYLLRPEAGCVGLDRGADPRGG